MADLYQLSQRPDPTADWRRLRETQISTALLDTSTGQTIPVLARYADVRAALHGSGGKDSSYLNRSTLAPLYMPCPEALSIIGELKAEPVTAAGDPPFHPPMRKMLESVFPWKLNQLPPYHSMIQEIVDDLLGEINDLRTVDLADVLAAELPLRVILHLIGAPAGDGPMVRAWSDGQIHFIWGRPTPDEQVRVLRNLISFWEYCLDLVKGDLPRESVTARLMVAGATPNQAASFAFNLLVAGHETTRSLIANMFLLLLQQRDRWERVRAAPELVPRAVAETSRYMPAIVGWLRETARDVVFDEATLPAGTRVLLHLGAANRDMPNGDDFDLHARRMKSLSFGVGPHYCIGAFLAILEAETTLATALRRFPDLELAPGFIPSYPQNLGFRAPRELRVTTGH
ncbi:cytochrome P450 [Actinomadura sp. HBU206391]|uniref:cytochrome P450 n=1 Tax=Actinomadura sp. HBU206391 TaxID=2731692 RepID=UPI00164EFDDA|nr:cytochrome P450 [Actinomadura sp. HBU206391]MBC6459113.1 cytochrome P450 [Actinomadura sp. HBU206391]